MSDLHELTAAESKFFETGELPPELAAEQTPPATPAEPDLFTSAPVDPAPTETAGDTTPTTPTAPATPDPFLSNLQRQLVEAESRRLAAEQRLNDLMAQLQQAQTQQAAPDPTIDPFGHLQHQVSSISTAIQTLQQSMAQQDQQNALTQQLNSFVGQVREMRDAFSRTVPDFNDAYAHVRNMRMNDLRDAGIAEHMLPAALLQDEMTVAQTAIQSGRNPAQVIYDMAKRHGYTPKAAAAATAAAPATKVAQLIAGQAAAKNLPRAGADVAFSLETLKDASESDLNKLVQSDDLWNKTFGGHGNDIF